MPNPNYPGGEIARCIENLLAIVRDDGYAGRLQVEADRLGVDREQFKTFLLTELARIQALS